MILIGMVSVHSRMSAQGRKLPNISFVENSVAFANANRSYDEAGQMTDTLRDERIVQFLGQILIANPDISIELTGHIALGEDTSLGRDRALLVQKLLMEQGVDQKRLAVINQKHDQPIISDDVIRSLPTEIERNAAHQRNRRVVAQVSSVKEETSPE